MKLFNCHVLFLIVIVFHVPIFFLFLCNEMSDFSSCNGRNWGGGIYIYGSDIIF